ncbi:hypothetical protein Tco_0671601, partial [Tanacetum coccineum]
VGSEWVGTKLVGREDIVVVAGIVSVGNLHLFRDGPTDGDGESEVDDGDEYIKTLRLFRGGGNDDGCDVSNDEDDKRDLLRDDPEYGDDGADDEDADSDDDEYSDDCGDEEPHDKPDDSGGDVAIH